MAEKEVIIWGVTAMARLVAPILEGGGYRVVQLYDDDPHANSQIAGVPFMQDDRAALQRWIQGRARKPHCAVAIGGMRGKARVEIGQLLLSWGVNAPAIVDPAAAVAPSAHIGAGCHILRGSTVTESAQLGEFVIINIGAVIDHDCQIGAGTHIMPGAVLTGAVRVGRNVAIGANATILPDLEVGDDAVIGAGSVVTENIPARAVAYGSPARVRRMLDG